jgi:uncharacterized membrane protein
MHGLLLVATLLAGVGSALVGGVFFAFSGFVLRGLSDVPAECGVAGMRSINAAAQRPPLMIAMFGTGLLCLALALRALVGLDHAYAGWLLAGGSLYLVGAIGVTAAFHVPRNLALDRARLTDADRARVWHAYLASWGAGNHVRCAASLLAAGLLGVAAVTG